MISNINPSSKSKSAASTAFSLKFPIGKYMISYTLGKPMNVRELLSRHEAGQRDFRNLNLMAANLRNMNLSGANLSGVNFTQANLTRTNLSHANLTGAILTGADLTQTNLRNAILTNVTVDAEGLSHAYLNGATMPRRVQSNGSKLVDQALGESAPLV
jgi:uncharacterized protein YjbI with pentapeptide repeats